MNANLAGSVHLMRNESNVKQKCYQKVILVFYDKWDSNNKWKYNFMQDARYSGSLFGW